GTTHARARGQAIPTLSRYLTIHTMRRRHELPRSGAGLVLPNVANGTVAVKSYPALARGTEGFVGLLAVTQSWRGQDCVTTCFLPKASERADAVGAAEPGWRVIALPRDAQIVVSARLLRRNEQGVVAASDVEEPFAMAVDVAER